MAFGAFLAFYPTLMLEEYNISLRLSGGILALGVIVGGIGGMAIAWAASRTGREKNFVLEPARKTAPGSLSRGPERAQVGRDFDSGLPSFQSVSWRIRSLPRSTVSSAWESLRK